MSVLSENNKLLRRIICSLPTDNICIYLYILNILKFQEYFLKFIMQQLIQSVFYICTLVSKFNYFSYNVHTMEII